MSESHSEEEQQRPASWAVRIHSQATADIAALVLWLASLEGVEFARAWQNGLIDHFATLAVNPERKALAFDANRFRTLRGRVRHSLYQRTRGAATYRVLFTLVTPELDAPFVHILAVRHGAARGVTRAEAAAIEAVSERETGS